MISHHLRKFVIGRPSSSEEDLCEKTPAAALHKHLTEPLSPFSPQIYLISIHFKHHPPHPTGVFPAEMPSISSRTVSPICTSISPDPASHHLLTQAYQSNSISRPRSLSPAASPRMPADGFMRFSLDNVLGDSTPRVSEVHVPSKTVAKAPNKNPKSYDPNAAYYEYIDTLLARSANTGNYYPYLHSAGLIGPLGTPASRSRENRPSNIETDIKSSLKKSVRKRKSVTFNTAVIEEFCFFDSATSPSSVTSSPRYILEDDKFDLDEDPIYSGEIKNHIKLVNFPKAIPFTISGKRSRVETVTLIGDYIVGRVAVLNLSFEKGVFIRYSKDNWATCEEIRAQYVSSTKETLFGGAPLNCGIDLFEFKILSKPLFDEIEREVQQDSTILPKTFKLQFATRYEVNSEVFWDNNSEQNYDIELKRSFVRYPYMPLVSPCKAPSFTYESSELSRPTLFSPYSFSSMANSDTLSSLPDRVFEFTPVPLLIR